MISLYDDFLPWFYSVLPGISHDCALHGLQIEGRPYLKRIGFAVSVTQEVCERALSYEIDTLIVHHGLFWNKQMLRGPIFGALKKHFEFFICNQISLLGAHLPLDIHPLWGNNVLLGQKIGLTNPIVYEKGLLWRQKISHSSKKDFFEHCTRMLSVKNHNLLDMQDAKEIHDLWIGWCTGAGGSFLESLPYCDVFLTGEVPERSWELAKMQNTLLMTLGHDDSEIYGIVGLKEECARHYGKNIELFLL